MIKREWIIELHNLANQIELAGQSTIARGIRLEADRLSEVIEKARIIKIKEELNGRHSRID